MIINNGIQAHLVTQDGDGFLDAIITEQGFGSSHRTQLELLVARRTAGTDIEEGTRFLVVVCTNTSL